MANEYLKFKWAMWFRCLDIRHAGRIARSDEDAIDQKLVQLHHLKPEERKPFLEKIDQWWTEYIFRNKSGSITEQEFVEKLNEDYKADKDKFKQRMITCMETIHAILDVSQEGSMTEEEYVIAYRSAGHENITLDKEFFNAYEPVDGKVSVKKISDSWVHFTTCDDSSVRDIVKEAFDKGV